MKEEEESPAACSLLRYWQFCTLGCAPEGCHRTPAQSLESAEALRSNFLTRKKVVSKSKENKEWPLLDAKDYIWKERKISPLNETPQQDSPTAAAAKY